MLKTADVRNRLAGAGVEPVGITPRHFGVVMNIGMQRVGKLVRASGIEPG